MAKVVAGAYGTVEETIRAVFHLLEEGNRSPNEIVIVANDENRNLMMNQSPVKVDGISTDSHRSAWESFKSMFSSKFDRTPLEEYGVDITTAREYNDAIRFGKFVVLVEENTGGTFSNTYQKAEGRDVRDMPTELLGQTENKFGLKKEAGEGLDLTDPSEHTNQGRVPPE